MRFRFGVLLSFVVIICLSGSPARALFGSSKSKKSKQDLKDFKKVLPSDTGKKTITDPDKEIPRTQHDKEMDTIVQKHLGSDFRRANVFDFYGMELTQERISGLNAKEAAEVMEYYNYARKDLEKICRSKFIPVVKMDMNADRELDYSIVVKNLVSDQIMLAIVNSKGKIYLEPFKATFIEKVNEGNYPTTVVLGAKRRTINSPSLRLVAFEEDSQILYFDQKKKSWELLTIGQQ
ncbi:MAG: hypothetical protein RLZZ361_84 [Cyanobacteriota bacterium]